MSGLKVVEGNLKGDKIMKTRYYLAYGSNLNLSQMRGRCPFARPIGTAELKDYTLLFKGSKTGNYLTVEPKEGDSVPEGVWEVTPHDERHLDFYEGYPNFYYKKDLKLPVKRFNSKEEELLDVFIYIMHEDHPLGLPTDYYLRTCIQGYSAFHFDLERLRRALIESDQEELL